MPGANLIVDLCPRCTIRSQVVGLCCSKKGRVQQSVHSQIRAFQVFLENGTSECTQSHLALTGTELGWQAVWLHGNVCTGSAIAHGLANSIGAGDPAIDVMTNAHISNDNRREMQQANLRLHPALWPSLGSQSRCPADAVASGMRPQAPRAAELSTEQCQMHPARCL